MPTWLCLCSKIAKYLVFNTCLLSCTHVGTERKCSICQWGDRGSRERTSHLTSFCELFEFCITLMSTFQRMHINTVLLTAPATDSKGKV